MKAASSAKTIILAVFLLVLFPLGWIIQTLVLGADLLSLDSTWWFDVQRYIVVGSFSSLAFSLIVPDVFRERLKKRLFAALCVVGLLLILLGSLSMDLGSDLLPRHWFPVSDLLGVALLIASGFLLALPVACDGEGSVGSKAVLLFSLLGYLALFLINQCSGGLLDSVDSHFWMAASFTLCFLVVCFQARESIPSLLSRAKRPFTKNGLADSSGSATTNAPKSHSGVCEEGAVRVPEEELSAYGFSDREQEAVRLMLERLTSESSAELMGVKPATVRTYLQRAYKKIGVVSAEEARLLLLPSDGGDEKNPGDGDGQESLEGDKELDCERVLSSGPVGRFVVILPLMTLLLLAVPHEQLFAPESWYYSEVFALSLGLGLMIAGLGLLCHGAPLRLLRQRRTLFLPLFVALVLVGLALVTLPAWRSFLPIGGRGLLLGMLLCFTSCGLSLVSVGLGVFWGSPQVDGRAVESDIPLLLFAVVLGFVFEDTWRAATDDFTWLLQLAFLSVLLVYCLVVSKRRPLLGLCYVALAVCAIGVGFGIRAVLVGLFSFSFALFVLNGGIKEERNAGIVLVGFGGSLVASRLISDYWWDVMNQGAVSASVHGGQWLLGAMMPALESLLLISGLAAFFVVVERGSSLVDEDSWEQEDSSIALYLRSRGLVSLEVETISGVLQGKTSAQIAKESHYAVGSVNSARWSAYRKLGVHSKKELAELLRANGF